VLVDRFTGVDFCHEGGVGGVEGWSNTGQAIGAVVAVFTEVRGGVVCGVTIGFFGCTVTGPAGFVDWINCTAVSGVLVEVTVIAKFHGSGVDKFV